MQLIYWSRTARLLPPSSHSPPSPAACTVLYRSAGLQDGRGAPQACRTKSLPLSLALMNPLTNRSVYFFTTRPVSEEGLCSVKSRTSEHCQAGSDCPRLAHYWRPQFEPCPPTLNSTRGYRSSAIPNGFVKWSRVSTTIRVYDQSSWRYDDMCMS